MEINMPTRAYTLKNCLISFRELNRRIPGKYRSPADRRHDVSAYCRVIHIDASLCVLGLHSHCQRVAWSSYSLCVSFIHIHQSDSLKLTFCIFVVHIRKDFRSHLQLVQVDQVHSIVPISQLFHSCRHVF